MSKPLRVLILEDTPDDADLLELELRRAGYDLTVECVCTAEAMSAALRRRQWDIIISDYAMPGFSGLAAIQVLQQSGLDIPFILVSGTVGEETAVAAMKAGASDYLVKGHLARLTPAIERELREADDRRQRKNAQHALQESEARFRSLSASSPIGVFQTDDRGRTLYFNERCLAIMGLTHEEALDDGWIKAVHPDDRNALLAHWSAATQNHTEFSHEFRLSSPGGRIRWVHSRAAVLRTGTGEAGGFVGTLEDITERTEAQARIRRQFERLSTQRAIDVAILSSSSLTQTLDVILHEATASLGVDGAGCLLLNPQTGMLEYSGGCGEVTSRIIRLPVPVGEGHAGLAMLERRPIYVPDPREADTGDRPMVPVAGASYMTYYAVPLIANGDAQGVLELYHREPLHPDAEWLEYLDTLAGQAAIAVFNARLIEGVRRSHAELAIAYDATLEGWVKALDLRDNETEGHTQRVTEMTLRLARAMGMSEGDLVHIRRGALLHDIGKIGVPDEILLKPGTLTDEEWIVMRRHPVHAFEWLSPISYLAPCLDIPHCHHEKWDGSGYPRGLAGGEIPHAARLFAVVDVWDALRSDRPYRKGWPDERVREHILSLAGTHFDPMVVEVFLTLIHGESALDTAA
jgi:PAS domain S-box-containing protein